MTFTITGGAAPFSVSPTSGTLAGGQSQQVNATIDRGGIPEGQQQTRSLQISGGGETFPLELRGSAERPPVISASTPGFFRSGPFGAGCVLQFFSTADITDESPPVSAVFSMSGPSGQSSSVAMTPPTSVGPYTGSVQFIFVSAADVNGSWSWSVSATDARGNSSSASGSVPVSTTC